MYSFKYAVEGFNMKANDYKDEIIRFIIDSSEEDLSLIHILVGMIAGRSIWIIRFSLLAPSTMAASWSSWSTPERAAR